MAAPERAHLSRASNDLTPPHSSLLLPPGRIRVPYSGVLGILDAPISDLYSKIGQPSLGALSQILAYGSFLSASLGILSSALQPHSCALCAFAADPVTSEKLQGPLSPRDCVVISFLFLLSSLLADVAVP